MLYLPRLSVPHQVQDQDGFDDNVACCEDSDGTYLDREYVEEQEAQQYPDEDEVLPYVARTSRCSATFHTSCSAIHVKIDADQREEYATATDAGGPPDEEIRVWHHITPSLEFTYLIEEDLASVH